jgi:hypothetical protein
MKMDHNVVVREKMTEKYLLNELDPEVRDRFEEHFFDCRECALDVRAAAEFVEQTKAVLAEERHPVPVPAPAPAPVPAWLAWLQTAFRPAFAVPAMALLLAVVGYQNLVTLPQMSAALHSPQVLPWASVNVGTFGSDGKTITVRPGSGFLLFVRIPPEGGYAHYAADLYNPAGKLEWSLTIPATENQDQWPVQVPAAKREPGTYTMAVHGITAAGESKEIGKTSFELLIQQ